MADEQHAVLPTGGSDETMEPTVHHKSARKRRGRPPAKMTLNLTSMIDVIFQLLIYFVVTANFMLDEGVLTAKMPQGSGKPTQAKLEPPPRPLNIELVSAGSAGVQINVAGAARITNFTELSQQLVALQYDPERGRRGAYKPDNPVIIKPAGQVRWQHVVNAFNAAIKARYSNVSFAQSQ